MANSYHQWSLTPGTLKTRELRSGRPESPHPRRHSTAHGLGRDGTEAALWAPFPCLPSGLNTGPPRARVQQHNSPPSVPPVQPAPAFSCAWAPDLSGDTGAALANTARPAPRFRRCVPSTPRPEVLSGCRPLASIPRPALKFSRAEPSAGASRRRATGWQCAHGADRGRHPCEGTPAKTGRREDSHTHRSDGSPSSGLGADSWSAGDTAHP